MAFDDIVYLKHILECIKFIQKYCKKLSFSEFNNNELLRMAVVRQLEVIGEAAGMVSKKTRSELKDVKWNRIVAMRNKLIHEYFGVDWKVVWTTVNESLPDLKKSLSDYLR